MKSEKSKYERNVELKEKVDTKLFPPGFIKITVTIEVQGVSWGRMAGRGYWPVASLGVINSSCSSSHCSSLTIIQTRLHPVCRPDSTIEQSVLDLLLTERSHTHAFILFRGCEFLKRCCCFKGSLFSYLRLLTSISFMGFVEKWIPQRISEDDGLCDFYLYEVSGCGTGWGFVMVALTGPFCNSLEWLC